MESVILLAMKIAHHRGRPLKDFVQETAGRIAARDAEIRRECTERAQDEWEQLFCDDMIDDREFVTKKLRAAIIGEEE